MSDQAEALRAYVAQNPEVKQTPTEPDYRALWLGLKAELEREAEGHIVRELSDDPEFGVLSEDKGYQRDMEAQRILDRMEQAETLARFKVSS